MLHDSMSDLALPFLLLFEDDVIAFWCFERLMRKVRLNFDVSSKGILAKLASLAHILQLVDPVLQEKLIEVSEVPFLIFSIHPSPWYT